MAEMYLHEYLTHPKNNHYLSVNLYINNISSGGGGRVNMLELELSFEILFMWFETLWYKPNHVFTSAFTGQASPV